MRVRIEVDLRWLRPPNILHAEQSGVPPHDGVQRPMPDTEVWRDTEKFIRSFTVSDVDCPH
jgi:hypothetical protein